MGIQPSEARALSWQEYQARVDRWADAHTPPEEEQAEAPDADFVARRQQRLADKGLARTLH